MPSASYLFSVVSYFPFWHFPTPPHLPQGCNKGPDSHQLHSGEWRWDSTSWWATISPGADKLDQIGNDPNLQSKCPCQEQLGEGWTLIWGWGRNKDLRVIFKLVFIKAENCLCWGWQRGRSRPSQDPGAPSLTLKISGVLRCLLTFPHPSLWHSPSLLAPPLFVTSNLSPCPHLSPPLFKSPS